MFRSTWFAMLADVTARDDRSGLNPRPIQGPGCGMLSSSNSGNAY